MYESRSKPSLRVMYCIPLLSRTECVPTSASNGSDNVVIVEEVVYSEQSNCLYIGK